MDITVLANFVRVAEAGSLQSAAGSLHLAQPTLSRQMAALEREFGARLLIRHRRGVALTAAGEELRTRAESILAELEHTRQAVSASARQPMGEVSLGLPTSMRYVLSAGVVAGYTRTYPEVFLRVHEAIGHVIEDLLRRRRLDVAILVSIPRHLDHVELTPLANEDLYLAGPPEAGLRLDSPVSVGDLADLPVILLSPENQVRAGIETMMQREGLRLDAGLEVEGQPLVLDLVRNGVGYTVLPFCAVEAELAAGRVSGAPIEGLTITWTLGVSRMRAHAPAVRELVRMIREAIDARITSGEWRVAAPTSGTG